MRPYIINVDRTTPMGMIVGEYGDNQWKKGFISGVCIGGILVWITLWFRKN